MDKPDTPELRFSVLTQTPIRSVAIGITSPAGGSYCSLTAVGFCNFSGASKSVRVFAFGERSSRNHEVLGNVTGSKANILVRSPPVFPSTIPVSRITGLTDFFAVAEELTREYLCFTQTEEITELRDTTDPMCRTEK